MRDSLNEWLHDLHQVTGDIVLSRGRPKKRDLDEWILTLERVTSEMREKRDETDSSS